MRIQRAPLRTLIVALIASTAATAAAARGDETPPPSVAEACGSAYEDLPARSFWAQTADGVRLYMAEAGTGDTALVLAHGGRSDICDTLDFGLQAFAKGYRVVSFDSRGAGRSAAPSRNRLSIGKDIATAVAHARRSGAAHVFLVGSSRGGAAIVQNTSTLRVDGRISLSGTRLWRGYGINNPAGPPRIRDPFLYVGSRADSNAPLEEALGIFRTVGARDKRTALYPGSYHGWQIVEISPYAARARALVFSWIERHA
jgi:pimeloyl-ACP methyl ester carboxylesterase